MSGALLGAMRSFSDEENRLSDSISWGPSMSESTFRPSVAQGVGGVWAQKGSNGGALDGLVSASPSGTLC